MCGANLGLSQGSLIRLILIVGPTVGGWMGHPFPWRLTGRFNCLQKEEGKFPSLPWQLICFSTLTIAHLMLYPLGKPLAHPTLTTGKEEDPAAG